MNRYHLIFCLLFFNLHKSGYAQEPDIISKVLRKNTPNKTYKFKNKSDGENLVNYLGKLKNKNGKEYKIVTSIWRWGIDMHRATSNILIYTQENKYLGRYHLSMDYDIPDKISKNKLVFLNNDMYKDKSCDPKLVSEVSFYHGIPSTFFLKCKGKYGDLIYFSE